MKSRSIGIVTIGASLLLAPLARAQGLDQSLYPQNPDLAVKYGSGIAVDENTLVVVDLGARLTAANGCGINDGAVYIYRRPSWTAPWPSAPNQTLIGGIREGHFGEHVVLRGNTLLIAESRWSATSGVHTGAIHYYTRPNANANFSLVQTTVPPVTGTMLGRVGLVSNGRLVAAAAPYGPEPMTRVYKLSPSGLQPHATIVSPAPSQETDEIALTDNDILIFVQDSQPTVKLFKITNHGVIPIDTSALTLTNGPGETEHVYTGDVDVRGTDVVLATKRRSTAAPPNDDTTYALRVFSVEGGVISPYGEAEIPGDLNLGDGYTVATRGLEIIHGPSVLVNMNGSNPMRTLGFEYSSGQFDLTFELDQADFNPDAGTVGDNHYTQPAVFDGQHLYLGDINDTTNAGGPPCGGAIGSVRIFDSDFGGNPSTICAGEQNVVVRFDPLPGASNFQWWGNGTSSISGSGFMALVDFASYAAQPSVSLGVNLNQAPWFKQRTHTVTAKPCGIAETLVDGPWYACSAGQDYPYYTHAVAGATAYNWSSPGTTNITSSGNTALVDFKTNFSSTTLRVGIQLSVPPYYTERTLLVDQMACGRFGP